MRQSLGRMDQYLCRHLLIPKSKPHLSSSFTVIAGKTTFVNTLCESEVIGHKISDNPETAHIEEGIKIKPVHVGELPHLCFRCKSFAVFLTSNLPSVPQCRARRGWHAHRPHYCRHTWIR